MIYTVTLNPALDYVLQVRNLRFDDINRSYFEALNCGGKGINVSVMLTRLGIPNKAMGFIAGPTGDRLEKTLQNDGIECSFLRLPYGDTRINVKIKSDTELDINARGPVINEDENSRLTDSMQVIKEGDFLVLAGSIPENLPPDTYERILNRLQDKGINFVVDTTGEALMRTLKYELFLIKPNHHELGELFGVKIENDKDVVAYALRLQKKGARNVLVSCGSKGAVLVDENGGITTVGTVEGDVVNTVGSGDSMVAGFLAGYIENKDFKYALRLGAACGNATAFCDALAQPEHVKNIFERLRINSFPI